MIEAPPLAPRSEIAAPLPALREMRRSLVSARDEQIVRVVSYVDRLPDRGAADTLLAPLRPRLTQLRPPRPMGFVRLLFLPFDPVILDASRWRRGGTGIPRTALLPISRQVRATMGSSANAIEAGVAGHATDEVSVLLRHGAALWDQAAEILSEAAMPDDWIAETGLNASDHMKLTRPISLLLRHARAIETLVQDVANGDPPDVTKLRTVMTETGAAGLRCAPETATQAMGMLLAILLSRLPATSQLITIAADLGAANADTATRRAADQAIDFMLDEIEATDLGAIDLSQAADEITRVSALLDALQQPGPAQRPSRKARAERMRRQIDGACRARFDSDISAQVLTPARSLGPSASDAELMAIETTSRALRRFEGASRELAGGGHYDRVLSKAAESLTEPTANGIATVERARLVEILVGPERAMAVLTAG